MDRPTKSEQMFGMPTEWLLELIAEWQEVGASFPASRPLMGSMPMLATSMLSDAQECIACDMHDRARQYINRAKFVIKCIDDEFKHGNKYKTKQTPTTTN